MSPPVHHNRKVSSLQMYVYSIHGLIVESQIVLPGAVGVTGDPDLRIRVQRLDDEALEQRPSSPDRIWGAIQNELQFLVEDGARIIIDNRGQIEHDRIAAYVTGVLMAAALRQRGFLTLHASAVVRDGRGVAFLGDSGWGKSTLAAFLCRNGYQLVNDDLLVVQPDEDPVRALTGIPRAQLVDGPEGVFDDLANFPATCEGYNKRLVTVAGVDEPSCILTRLYLLSPPSEQIPESRTVPEHESMMALVQHSRATNLMSFPSDMKRNFAQSASLAAKVPMVRLGNHRSPERLPKLLRQIESDMLSTPVHTPFG
jgi:hypothetical protein